MSHIDQISRTQCYKGAHLKNIYVIIIKDKYIYTQEHKVNQLNIYITIASKFSGIKTSNYEQESTFSNGAECEYHHNNL